MMKSRIRLMSGLRGYLGSVMWNDEREGWKNMSAMFEKIVEEHKNTFNTTTMFGIPISKLNADVLRACICILGELGEFQRAEMTREREFWRSIKR